MSLAICILCGQYEEPFVVALGHTICFDCVCNCLYAKIEEVINDVGD
jgi:ribosomal protein L32